MLARFGFGASDQAARVMVPLRRLGGFSEESWWATGAFNANAQDGVQTLTGDDFMLCWAQTPAQEDVRDATYRLYQRLLNTLADAGFGHIIKGWNHLAQINAGEGDAERYKQFCIGRADAMAELWPHDYWPAGTGVGSDAGAGLQVVLLASRERPVLIENPRQMSAYDYPRQYGPRSPSFSRAAAFGSDTDQTLFVSGTAAIVGHQSQHVGDVRSQLHESVTNVKQLFDVFEQQSGLIARWRDLGWYRVYLRHPELLTEAYDQLLELGFPVERCAFLRADICREELLFEIDGIVPGTLRSDG